jgi:hypothetical protein
VSEAADGDHVEGVIGLSVAREVEAVTGGAAELACIGAAPQIFAKAASLFSRSMFWPAVTSSWLAPWVPTPNSPTVRGAAALTSCASC